MATNAPTATANTARPVRVAASLRCLRFPPPMCPSLSTALVCRCAAIEARPATLVPRGSNCPRAAPNGGEPRQGRAVPPPFARRTGGHLPLLRERSGAAPSPVAPPAGTSMRPSAHGAPGRREWHAGERSPGCRRASRRRRGKPCRRALAGPRAGAARKRAGLCRPDESTDPNLHSCAAAGSNPPTASSTSRRTMTLDAPAGTALWRRSPASDRLRGRRRGSIPHAQLLIDGHITGVRPTSGRFIRCRQLRRELARRPQIVVVQKGNPAALGGSDAGVAGAADAGRAGVAQQPDAIVLELPDDCVRARPRTVVHNEHFRRHAFLPEDTPERERQQLGAIARRDDHAHVHHRGRSAGVGDAR